MYCTVTSQMRFLRAPRHRYYHVITTADKYLVFGDGMVTRRHRARHPRRATLETIVLDRDRDRRVLDRDLFLDHQSATTAADETRERFVLF